MPRISEVEKRQKAKYYSDNIDAQQPVNHNGKPYKYKTQRIHNGSVVGVFRFNLLKDFKSWQKKVKILDTLKEGDSIVISRN